jgi:hypothetical protein
VEEQMFDRFEVPFPPRRPEVPAAHLSPPWVPIEPRWEYKEMVRDRETEQLLNEAELNALGSEGWELAGIADESRRVHFYFKRERAR